MRVDGTMEAGLPSQPSSRWWTTAPSQSNNPSSSSPLNAASTPYDDSPLLAGGTHDKLLIHGHYYSDKPIVPSLLIAAEYQAIQLASGLRARAHPAMFCYLMALLSSGVAYVLATTLRVGIRSDCRPHVCPQRLAGSRGKLHPRDDGDQLRRVRQQPYPAARRSGPAAPDAAANLR